MTWLKKELKQDEIVSVRCWLYARMHTIIFGISGIIIFMLSCYFPPPSLHLHRFLLLILLSLFFSLSFCVSTKFDYINMKSNQSKSNKLNDELGECFACALTVLCHFCDGKELYVKYRLNTKMNRKLRQACSMTLRRKKTATFELCERARHPSIHLFMVYAMHTLQGITACMQSSDLVWFDLVWLLSI